jgi:hypothetical protein
MKNKDVILLEQLYSKVKPTKLLTESNGYIIPSDDYFVAKLDQAFVNVYDIGNDADNLNLSIKEKEITFNYKLRVDFANWGIEDFSMEESYISPFHIVISDDYAQDDFAEEQVILKFEKELDTGLFKVDNLTIKQGQSLYPSLIDLWVKKVGNKWELVEDRCEISFIKARGY